MADRTPTSPSPPASAALLRVGVLISGSGRTLMNLHRLATEGQLPIRIVRVIASRPCGGVDKARAAGLDTHVALFKEMPDVQAYSQRIADLLAEAKVQLAVQAGFLSFWRIPPALEGRVMNIHPALLPGFGGKGMYGHHVHEAVLAAGCKVSGCTVHFVTNRYDEGPIIIQRCVPVREGDTPDTLAGRVFEQECLAYPEAIRLFAQGRLKIEGQVVRILDEQASGGRPS